MQSKITNKRILVTGGAGFIGSNLIESFLNSGNQVVCLDNFSTGKRENLSGFVNNRNFKLIEGDIRDYNSCQLALNSGIDLVFHQAALGSVPRSIKDPITTTDVNIGGFVRILYASIEAGVKRFVYAASSSTYGDNENLPKVENDIGKPLSPYAITKYADELFAENFNKIYGIEVIGLRYFNVFGRRQDPDGPYAAVIPKFVKMLKNHQQPVINGDGSISRDFTYIDNVILANHLAGSVEKSEALNQVYNVACGEKTSLNKMFELIKLNAVRFDVSISSIEALHGPEREGDIQHSLASLEKINRLLGYSPAHSVEKGLEESVEWFWRNL